MDTAVASGCRLFWLGGEPLLSDVRISQLFRNFHASSFTQRTRGAAVTVSTWVPAVLLPCTKP